MAKLIVIYVHNCTKSMLVIFMYEPSISIDAIYNQSSSETILDGGGYLTLVNPGWDTDVAKLWSYTMSNIAP